MKNIIYLLIGILFGVVMIKSEAASWFRIYEMFQLRSFHMYGIIGVALIIGMLMVQLIKRFEVKSIYGEPIVFKPKKKGFKSNLFGGIIFGLGWGLAGVCPGPIYTLIGAGFLPVLVVLAGALFGAFLHGLMSDYLPQ